MSKKHSTDADCPAVEFFSNEAHLRCIWPWVDRHDRASLFFSSRSIRDSVLRAAGRCEYVVDAQHPWQVWCPLRRINKPTQALAKACDVLQAAKGVGVPIRLCVSGTSLTPKACVEFLHHIRTELLAPLADGVKDVIIHASHAIPPADLQQLGKSSPGIQQLSVYTNGTPNLMPSRSAFPALRHLLLNCSGGARNAPASTPELIRQFLRSVAPYLLQLTHLDMFHTVKDPSLRDLLLLLSRATPAAPRLTSLALDTALTDLLLTLLNTRTPNLAELRVSGLPPQPLQQPCKLGVLRFERADVCMHCLNHVPDTVKELVWRPVQSRVVWESPEQAHDALPGIRKLTDIQADTPGGLAVVLCGHSWLGLLRGALQTMLEAAAALPSIGTLILANWSWSAEVAAQLQHLPEDVKHVEFQHFKEWDGWGADTSVDVLLAHYGSILSHLPDSCRTCKLQLNYWQGHNNVTMSDANMRALLSGAPKHRTLGTPLDIQVEVIHPKHWPGRGSSQRAYNEHCKRIVSELFGGGAYPHVTCKVVVGL